MVDVQESALGAFEENVLSSTQGAIDDATRMIDVLVELAPPFNALFIENIDIDRIHVVDLGEFDVLLLRDRLELHAKLFRLTQISDAHTATSDFIFVARAYAATGRTDLAIAGFLFTRAVKRRVPRKNHVCSTGYADP